MRTLGSGLRCSLRHLRSWLTKAGHEIDITCLRVGDTRMLHLPGELFVEYQLAAKAMRPDLHVMMAAYGDYGPGYIGTRTSYAEGGYETCPTSSSVAPEVEPILMKAMQTLLIVVFSGRHIGAGAIEMKVQRRV